VRLVAPALAGLLLLTGCSSGSSGSEQADPEPTVSTSAPVGTPSGTPSSTPSSTPSGTPSGSGPFDQQTGAQIAAAGAAAMKELSSLRYRLSVRGVPSEFAVDVRADDTGSCTGTVTVGAGRVQLRGVGDQQWFKADEAAWRAADPESADDFIAAAGGHWVLDDGFEFANFCFFDDLLGDMLDEVGTGAWFTSGSGRIDGHDVIRVQGSSTEGGRAVAAVRVDEPHYLASIQRTYESDGAVSTGRFSEFGLAVDATAPADDDVVDLSSLL
jgi:hypothetical protein